MMACAVGEHFKRVRSSAEPARGGPCVRHIHPSAGPFPHWSLAESHYLYTLAAAKTTFSYKSASFAPANQESTVARPLPDDKMNQDSLFSVPRHRSFLSNPARPDRNCCLLKTTL